MIALWHADIDQCAFVFPASEPSRSAPGGANDSIGDRAGSQTRDTEFSFFDFSLDAQLFI